MCRQECIGFHQCILLQMSKVCRSQTEFHYRSHQRSLISKKHLFQAEGFSLIEKYLIIFTTKIFQEMQGIIVHNTNLIYGSILQYEGALQASMLYLQQILLCRFCFDDYDRCQIANQWTRWVLLPDQVSSQLILYIPKEMVVY